MSDARHVQNRKEALKKPSVKHVVESKHESGNDGFEKQLKMSQSITKEDIIRVANLLKIDTIYLLKEGVR